MTYFISPSYMDANYIKNEWNTRVVANKLRVSGRDEFSRRYH